MRASRSRAIHYKINDDVCGFHPVLYATRQYYLRKVYTIYGITSYSGSAQLSFACCTVKRFCIEATESWAGPGNEATDKRKEAKCWLQPQKLSSHVNFKNMTWYFEQLQLQNVRGYEARICVERQLIPVICFCRALVSEATELWCESQHQCLFC